MTHVGSDQARTGSALDAVHEADTETAVGLARYRRHPAVRAIAKVAQVGDQAPLATAAGAVIAWGLASGNRRLARQGGHLLASVLVATALKNAIKRVVSRSRPNMLLDEGVQETKLLGPNEGPWHSFPSGHTAGSVALARACARCWPGTSVPAYAGAAAVALIQVPRGAHYPSDVLAGLVLGVTAEAIAARVLPPGRGGRPW